MTAVRTETSIGSRLMGVVPEPWLLPLIAWQYRLYERELSRVAELVPAHSTAVDAGAWWGPWTYWLAHVADRVVSCEPIPELASFIARYAPANVRVENVALSDRSGEVPLWVPRGGAGSEGRSSLDPALADGRRRLVVPAIKLDDLELQNVGFIKIDVEGHELQVLRGAAETIARNRPVLVVEVEDHFQHGAGVTPVFDFVRSFGYRGTFLHRGTWRDIDDFDVGAHQLQWQRRVQTSGYLKNLVFNARRYVNNFVFHPVGGGHP